MKTLKSISLVFLCLTLLLSLGSTPTQSQAQSINTFPPIVDGVVDESYGPVIATDPAGDSQGGNPVDLVNLWMTQDTENYYFAYEVNTDFTANNWGKYALYIDTTNDSNGATSDAWGRSVVVDDPHKPEFAAYTWVDNPPYGTDHTQLYAWDGSSWSNIGTVGQAAIGAGTTSIVEWSIPKDSLGNPSQLWVEVWSTGGGGGDNAQDTINFPSNDWQASDWGSLATLAVSTPFISVDGNLDPAYGYPIATDPSGDGNGNANMDLLNLWVTEDASQYYFIYSINADINDINWGKYAIYVDTTNNANGAPTDAWGRNVIVSDPHKPEFAFYTYLDAAPYGPEDTQFWAWDGSAWSQSGGVNEAALTAGASSFIEWAVEKNRLDNPQTLWLEVWDTGGGGGDNAQDTINDPADDWNANDWQTTAILKVSTQFPQPTEPPHASHDNDVWWDELGHNSRDTLYRTPGGPVTTGTAVTLRLRAASGDLTAAKVRLWNDRTNTQTLLPMSIAYDDGIYEWWQVTLPVSADPTVYWYRFLAIDGTDTDYYEDDAARTGGWGQPFDETNDYSYQLTIYDPSFQTPDWIKNAVVYQVFPDRFRDGDTTNDKPAGTFFYGEEGGTIYRSLQENWNEPICDPREEGPCAGTYSKNFYGGDLAGLIDKLDYLQDLGVNTIYLNPIFESPSNHGYDTTNYITINPMFGTEEEFQDLVTELNARDMHLILDGVFNHTSSDSIYFDRYSRYENLGACESVESPYRDWYFFTDVPAGSGPCVGSDGTPNSATYQSWWGYDTLPVLNSANPEVRAFIWDNDSAPQDTVAGHYMLTADGWRLDVGGDIDPGTINDPNNDYWEGFRETVKTVNPEGYIAGEEWGNASSWLLGGEWDAVMNYQFSTAVLSLWRDTPFTDNDHAPGTSAGELTPLTPMQFDERIQNLMERYNPESLQAMLNLFDSHDTNRALFMLDPNTYQNDPALYQDPEYDWTFAIERLKGAVAVQMTMPGAPTIYYGDEVGLVGPVAYANGKWEDDPYNRQPYPWLDESGTPYYTHLQTDDGQAVLRDYYTTLATARNEHPALRTGEYHTLLISDEFGYYTYMRLLPGEDAAVVLVNRNETSKLVTLEVEGLLPSGANFRDIFTGTVYTIPPVHRALEWVAVPANGVTVLVLNDATLAAPPEAVTDLAVTGVNPGTVYLDWSDTTGADEYIVYRSCLSGGGYELIGTSATSDYIDTDLTVGTRYYYIVIARNTTNGLASGPSNEVNARPAYAIQWANLQWPSTITHTIGITPTENIYGQVWIDGVTSRPGQTPTLSAQVGFGPDGSLPMENPAWIWSDAVYNVDVGENDEFRGTLLPEAVGVYDYAYRYTTTAGESWTYADLDGTGNGYSPDQAGNLIVNPSDDLTAPSAPNLSLTNWSASSIDLAWTEATDDVAIYAYDLYRSTDGLTFTKIHRELTPGLSYRDEAVERGLLYYYYVVAIDTSFNRSQPSNTVSHVAEPKMVAVTFDVTVPSFTPGTVFLTRVLNADGSIGDWNPAGTALTKVSDTSWSGKFDILDGTLFEFKFARGSWDTVMKGIDGNEELNNLSLLVDYGEDGTQLFTYTVLNWRDPIVTAFQPADGALIAPASAELVITWSQAMRADACPLLQAESGATIPGTCQYDPATFSHTFTPTIPLAGLQSYTATVSGKVDVGGDVQQVPLVWSFTTQAYSLYLPVISR
ncbi:MAG TPA: alpha-amylase family glycosyl hydrolase [Anaerolineaceae bacterium]|nr:alpha-amylase family glycosyl hydrolase [Anaerolineaceae bacterium]